MTVCLAGGTRLSLPASLVLATVLEEGRIEQRSHGGDLIKLLTAEASIRGQGRVVVRRAAGTTSVSAREGSFQVEAAGQLVTLAKGQGSIARSGAPPTPPELLARSPTALDPGGDPAYVEPGSAVTLSWRSTERLHHIEILGLDSDHVLISRDVLSSPVPFVLSWTGTFRWRVSSRSAAGLESPTSEEGLIAVFK